MAIVIIFSLASKLIARKYFKMNICVCVHTEYDPTKEPPKEDEAEEHPDEVYMNINKPKSIAKTSEDAEEQQDSNSSSNDQEEISYSNLMFTSPPTRTLPMQPETEYAEIVR
ncbi:unnamed protein product [Staurois parvus]|uniref:Uncharacterized protein n=1 Tax=Staurois parvus TaxID=386267 RepID=A0ABN9AFN4_9NEOB|nr:unnamed protein product [Staurois parvus]